MFSNGLASFKGVDRLGTDISVGSGFGVSNLDPSLPQDAIYSGLRMALLDATPLVPRASKRRDRALRSKRVVDVVVAILGLVLLAPLLLALAAAIVLTDGGPVLFRQKRLGLHGAPFQILKFRSMHVACCDPSGVKQVAVNDTRLTPIGAFMRRTSVDELPQLFNVLKGEMSLVGPRPHVPGMLAGGFPYAELVPHYGFRHSMRPGVTGWAQCHGLRGPTLDPRRAISRIGHDIAYVQNFSLWLDLKIMLRTMVVVTFDKDAL